MYLSNSLSFGVPAAKAAALLARAARSPSTKPALRQEVEPPARRARGGHRPPRRSTPSPTPPNGDRDGGRRRRPAARRPCSSAGTTPRCTRTQGITKTRYGCDLQFTPSLDEIGPVGSVELLVRALRLHREPPRLLRPPGGPRGGAPRGRAARPEQRRVVGAGVRRRPRGRGGHHLEGEHLRQRPGQAPGLLPVRPRRDLGQPSAGSGLPGRCT